MRENLIFTLMVFFFITIIFIFFPNQKNKKIKIDKNDIIIKVEKNDNYAAIISKNNNTIEENKIIGSPSADIKELQFKIENIRVLDKNQDLKNTFIFNELIYLYFDFELPTGFYTFKIETIPELTINVKDDVLRTGKGNTEKKPIIFSVLNTQNLEDVKLDEINIMIFKTDNYENPVFNYIHPTNITIKKLKINLIREEDFTSPLILSNT